MEKKSRITAAIGITGSAALLLADKLGKRSRQIIILTQDMPVPAFEAIDLIKQVEREPELIPPVSSVIVHERRDREVVYTVRSLSPLPVKVRYRKWWDEAVPAVFWGSEKGTLGFHHKGEIHFVEREGGAVAYLRSEHWVTAPLAGRIVGPAATPVIRTGLSAWLKNLAEELSRR